jgi:hypothetical protein
VSHLEPYPHHHGPLDVAGLSLGRPPTAGTNVPDNGLDPMVTMVTVRGGRATPPVKAAISVDPAAGASVPVWAAAIAPLGVLDCPLRRQLELIVGAAVDGDRAAGATACRHGTQVGAAVWGRGASDELLLVCAGEEGKAGTSGVPATN